MKRTIKQIVKQSCGTYDGISGGGRPPGRTGGAIDPLPGTLGAGRPGGGGAPRLGFDAGTERVELDMFEDGGG